MSTRNQYILTLQIEDNAAVSVVCKFSEGLIAEFCKNDPEHVEVYKHWSVFNNCSLIGLRLYTAEILQRNATPERVAQVLDEAIEQALGRHYVAGTKLVQLFCRRELLDPEVGLKEIYPFPKETK